MNLARSPSVCDGISSTLSLFVGSSTSRGAPCCRKSTGWGKLCTFALGDVGLLSVDQDPGLVWTTLRN
ncbi:hypothetical protein BASA81_006239 [Batrachochytrium salamandrivorans]|nr:hypothetical protein BASA81_011050 [Batrachochytrium salamandrivorans]KAH9255838.1 hypothetical protein BASA81_006239 [Batrachochytrium salamandrivorans]